MAATWKDRAKRTTVYPAPGQTRVPRSFDRFQERPTPFPGAAASAVDSRLPANAAMLAATAPLAGGSVYHLRVSGYVQATAGGPWTRLRTRAWSFTTA
jgi:hypothetical protein